ncbi:MAG: UTP--glucose-1-phosphate uridylyltransferase [Sphingomonadales bacterium]|nr:UTP--glucose-1-phosphate uridylyltransferase [Sphingomonadales bacterium]PIX64681.1 MAG: UTP--glucose-1-phosphate uridylyltransferase [Sphingomonadales bacterium CG_4_10_14_3_um_filter_58_15]NCO48447.1 UTP--glucose-1-phosphate uridylyltransferase [Sphingomonadales bacterium]NCO99263.1 UTP--glucose-1-phosphate uridylyltransferase [Sphingomonadales bacterium]NCP27711.1 UTP--glucose-1-phosphate uridylyltransferase [Sphingomonadales bacterium]
MKPIRKAVFPVAGMGTRFLPATKVMPKELFPIVDRPLLQYAVDEALEAGIEQMIFVNGRGKGMIEDHFDMAFELERNMADRSKDRSVLDGTRLRPGDCVFVRQQEPLGLGHAIWCARDIIGDEPFAIFLPDEFMVGSPGCMKQMVSAYDKLGGNIVCALEIPIEDTPSYGVIDPGYRDGPITEVKGLVEKPPAGTAPSNLILPGRYILQPEVMRILETQAAGAGGEIQLTDAMAQMIGQQPFHGMTFDGKRYDCGSKQGYVEANLALALSHPEIGAAMRDIAEKLLAE